VIFLVRTGMSVTSSKPKHRGFLSLLTKLTFVSGFLNLECLKDRALCIVMYLHCLGWTVLDSVLTLLNLSRFLSLFLSLLSLSARFFDASG
jgi:hypothetical protein